MDLISIIHVTFCEVYKVTAYKIFRKEMRKYNDELHTYSFER